MYVFILMYVLCIHKQSRGTESHALIIIGRVVQWIIGFDKKQVVSGSEPEKS
jgi:hypothetical protein